MTSRDVALTLDPTPEIARLRLRTEFRDGTEVAAFLELHAGVANALLNAIDRIPEFFGEGAPIALEMLWDPENPEHDALYALIQTSLPAEEALRRLKRFDEAWWLGAIDHARGGVTISLEFV